VCDAVLRNVWKTWEDVDTMRADVCKANCVGPGRDGKEQLPTRLFTEALISEDETAPERTGYANRLATIATLLSVRLMDRVCGYQRLSRVMDTLNLYSRYRCSALPHEGGRSEEPPDRSDVRRTMRRHALEP